ncbi:polyketide biosynthesis acyl carrier protein [Actinopolyspora lacussalsi]|nr:polyketide biosynthesis acyl carrier protein [Actinopolyspora lacussalsi]
MPKSTADAGEQSGTPDHEEWAEVRRVIGEILPGVTESEMTADRHLEQLGADSVDRVEIVLALKDGFGVREPLKSFENVPDLQSLVRFLHTSRTR